MLLYEKSQKPKSVKKTFRKCFLECFQKLFSSLNHLVPKTWSSVLAKRFASTENQSGKKRQKAMTTVARF